MKPGQALRTILIAGLVLAPAAPALATGNCATGKTLYATPVSGLTCGMPGCHGPGDPSAGINKIQNGANNPTKIANAINGGVGAMAVFIGKYTTSDLSDIATWIAAAPTCPAGGAPVISVAPASFTFAPQNVGSTSAATTITVSNTGTAAATGLSIANSNAAEFPATNTCPASLANGASCTISASFSPSGAGARSGSITVTSTGSGSPQAIAVSGTGTSVATPGVLSVPAAFAFGTQTVGVAGAPQAFTLTNTGGTAVTIGSMSSSNAAEFAISSSSCSGAVAVGASCSFSVTFTASAEGARSASITVSSTGTGSPQRLALTGTGTSVPTPGALTLPAAYAFADQTVAVASAAKPFTLANTGGAAVTISGVASSNAAEFAISASTCTGSIAPGATCSFTVTFTPSATGARSSAVTVTSTGVGSPQTIALSGTGVSKLTPPPPSGCVTDDVVEYYYPPFDHYFMTTGAVEVTALDAGTFSGWVRTGHQFKACKMGAPDVATVCRFFSTAFAPKSSHFYTNLKMECDLAKTYPAWTFEGEVFNVPGAAADGTCPVNTVPVYRLYNNGQGGAPNHRYVTELAVRDQMLAAGWVVEGNLPGLAFMCAPQ